MITEIAKGTKRAGSGMYIGEPNHPEIKENRNILITQYPDESSAYQQEVGIYKRNSKYHKKGETKYKTYYTKWIRPYSSVLQAWESIYEYPTVSYGFTKNERNVFVVDVDEEFESIESAKKYIAQRTKVIPSYVIRNPSSGHIQFGFVMKNGIKVWNFQYFNKGIKILAKKFNSDSAFNGPACKNPYFPGFESEISGIVYNSVKDLKELFLNEAHSHSVVGFSNTVAYKAKALGSVEENKSNNNILSSSSSSFVLYNTNPKLKENKSNNNILSSSSSSFVLYNTNPNLNLEEYNSNFQNGSVCNLIAEESDGTERSSLNNNHVRTYMKLLRNRIFKYFRETGGKECEIETAKVFEKETIAEMEEMGYIFNNMKQTIDATVKILKWCNTKGLASFGKRDNTLKGEANTSLFQINSRRKSLETRHAKMMDKRKKFREWMSENASIVDLESKGKPAKGKISKREAAKRIGITYDEFRAYIYAVKRGEISYETNNSNRSNQENESVQTRFAGSGRSSNCFEREAERKEQGNRILEETAERGFSESIEEIQIPEKAAG